MIPRRLPNMIVVVMRAIAFLVLVACGGTAKQTAPTASAASAASATQVGAAGQAGQAGPASQTEMTTHVAPGASKQAGPVLSPKQTAEVFCTRMTGLARDCYAFSKVVVTDRCVAEYTEVLELKPQDTRATAAISCIAEGGGCEETQLCLQERVTDPAADGELQRACDERLPSGALRVVGIPADEWARRKGVGVTTFSAVRSTKAAPVEMCGVSAAHRWLMSLRCDNGSQPLFSLGKVSHARTGNLGAGGRCGSVIDHYEVACPEAKYEIFIDPYMCARRD